MIRIIVFRDKKGEWRWRLRMKNGQITAGPQEGYASKRNAYKAANRIKNIDWSKVYVQ